jgi:5-histidylcysteine sulfoxide synthase
MKGTSSNVLPRPQMPPRLDSVEKQELSDYLDRAWRLGDTLMRSITDEEAIYTKADPLRHPLIFYLGHTASFYINKLCLAGALAQGIDPGYEELFAKGVDPDRAKQLASLDWPRQQDVWNYRDRVHETIAEWIEREPLELPIARGSGWWALLMGIEHDLIHFETSSVLIRQYPKNLLTRPEGWHYAPETEAGAPRRLIAVEAGRARLGKPADFPTYGWDNEYGSLQADVPGFEVANNLVTNAEFLEFVAADGYERKDLWTEAGWQWLRETGTTHPPFWLSGEGDFRYRAMYDELALPGAWPVEVNCHEALAYCRLLGEEYRLLRETEFARLGEGNSPPGSDVIFGEGHNLALRFGSPCAVGSIPSATTPRGVNDLFGNVWDWLADDFHPLPGFRADPLYLDFSAPYFTDKHTMMLGGSWASLGTSASRFYRLWFRRRFYQHAGFRVARSRP